MIEKVVRKRESEKESGSEKEIMEEKLRVRKKANKRDRDKERKSKKERVRKKERKKERRKLYILKNEESIKINESDKHYEIRQDNTLHFHQKKTSFKGKEKVSTMDLDPMVGSQTPLTLSPIS